MELGQVKLERVEVDRGRVAGDSVLPSPNHCYKPRFLTLDIIYLQCDYHAFRIGSGPMNGEQ